MQDQGESIRKTAQRKKLIDADRLKESLRSFLGGKALGAVELAIDAQPKIDAVEVVKCGNCIFYRSFTTISGRCTLMDIYPTPSWFCKCGTEGRDDIS